jgi:hypothetical protein
MTQNKRAPAGCAAEALVGDCKNASRDKPTPAQGQLVDRYGHVHSEAVLTHWSPQALKVLGIRRVGDEPKGGAR